MLRRLSRLFQADFHAVLDQLEDPEALIKQSLREMESEIAELEAHLHNLQQEQIRTQQHISKCEQALEHSEEQLQLCFDSEDEALARTMLRRKLEWQRQLEALTEKHQLGIERITETESRLHNYQQRYYSIRQKADVFIDDTCVDACHHTDSHSMISEEELQVAWLAEQSKRKNTSSKTTSNKNTFNKTKGAAS